MTPEELKKFRDNVAEPAMQKLLAKTNIPEGYCLINNLDISFYDGRSWGVDSEIIASGLRYTDGKVEGYSYRETDFDLSEFIQAHRNCVFLSDGKLRLYNELDEIELASTIRNIDFCSQMFPEIPKRDDLSIVFDSLEAVKMSRLLELQEELAAKDHKVLCAGCSDGYFFAIQQYQGKTEADTYFDFYSVYGVPSSMSHSDIERFMMENAGNGSSVAGSLNQVMDEFKDFLSGSCLELDAAQQQPLIDRIAEAKGRADQSTPVSRTTPEIEPNMF